jgi:hypothetical protein
MLTTTTKVFVVSVGNLYFVSARNRYNLYDTKNERFIVSVVADQHKKWIFENKKIAELIQALPILPPSPSSGWKEVVAAPRSMPAIIELPQEGATIEGGPAPPPVVTRRQGWRALLHRRRTLGLYRRAALGLCGGDRRRALDLHGADGGG